MSECCRSICSSASQGPAIQVCLTDEPGRRRCGVARRPRVSFCSRRLPRMGHTPCRSPTLKHDASIVEHAPVPRWGRARLPRTSPSSGREARLSIDRAQAPERDQDRFAIRSPCGQVGARAITAMTPSTPAVRRAGTTPRRKPRSQTAARAKDAELPEVGELPPERNGGAGDRANDRGARSGQEGLDPTSAGAGRSEARRR